MGERTPNPFALYKQLQNASASSYRKHCGPRAVECAEGDLLGEAIEALKTCPSLACVDPILAKWWAEVAAPIIAKATGKETRDEKPNRS